MDVVRARWSSSSFLLYAGSLVVLAATVALLGSLSDDYGDWAFLGWSALVLVVLTTATVVYERAGLAVAAGLCSFVALVAFIIFVGAFESVIGLLDGDERPIEGFDFGLQLLYLAAFIAALVQLIRYHFPLHVSVAAAAGWLFVVDLISNGGDWSAVVSIFLGLFFLLVGAGVDRTYGFWVQLVASLSIGGGFLYLWHSASWEWVLIGIISLIFFLFAAGLDRSSYAVLGAVGLFLAWSHFVEKWLDSSWIPSFFGGEGGQTNVWGRALLYALYGFVLVLIGLWLERRRPATVTGESSPASA